MNDHEKLVENIERDVKRQEKHERTKPTFIGVVFYGGTLGLLFVVPLLIGAYLGRWIDAHVAGYSTRWTVSLILLGIAIGAWNVIRFLKERL